MNENINIAPQESKLVIYLVVAAKVIVYMLLMLGFAGVLGAVCIKAVSFFKIDGTMKEVVMQSSLLAGTFLAAWVLLKNWDHLPITDLGLSLKERHLLGYIRCLGYLYCPIWNIIWVGRD